MEDVDGALLDPSIGVVRAQPDQPFAQGRPLLALFREAYYLVAAHAAQGIRLWTAAGMSSATRTIGIPVWIA